jgi:hypothetical protein
MAFIAGTPPPAPGPERDTPGGTPYLIRRYHRFAPRFGPAELARPPTSTPSYRSRRWPRMDRARGDTSTGAAGSALTIGSVHFKWCSGRIPVTLQHPQFSAIRQALFPGESPGSEVSDDVSVV